MSLVLIFLCGILPTYLLLHAVFNHAETPEFQMAWNITCLFIIPSTIYHDPTLQMILKSYTVFLLPFPPIHTFRIVTHSPSLLANHQFPNHPFNPQSIHSIHSPRTQSPSPSPSIMYHQTLSRIQTSNQSLSLYRIPLHSLDLTYKIRLVVRCYTIFTSYRSTVGFHQTRVVRRLLFLFCRLDRG